MKKILIATDFSANATEAAKFAIRLADKNKASVSFVHVYSLPVIHTDYPEMIDYKAFEDAKQKQMENWMKQWSHLHSTPNMELLSGFSFYDELNAFLRDHSFDLLVIGMTGVSNIGGLLLGSNTLSLITHAPIPVLAIPQSWDEQKEIQNIGFAFDGKPIENSSSIPFLIEFSFLFNKEIQVCHVSSKRLDELSKAEISNKLISLKHQLQIEENEDVNNGILNFTANNHIDVLALIPKKHHFLNRLFHTPNTPSISQVLTIPILALPE